MSTAASSNCASVSPVFNRCVIFSTDADSYHGHPDPLQCPPDVYRRSIALYNYYTASREIYKGRCPMSSLCTAPDRRMCLPCGGA